jgi:hypothetical protein
MSEWMAGWETETDFERPDCYHISLRMMINSH